MSLFSKSQSYSLDTSAEGCLSGEIRIAVWHGKKFKISELISVREYRVVESKFNKLSDNGVKEFISRVIEQRQRHGGWSAFFDD